MRTSTLLLTLTVSLTTASPARSDDPITVKEEVGRLIFSQRDDFIGEFHFAHPTLLRPGFANLRAPGGIPVTRNFPPVAGVDATDHADLHPGIWLAFGDISGEDFWRNKGSIRHERFTANPLWNEDHLSFATLSTFVTDGGTALGTMSSHFTLRPQGPFMRITWDASITPTTDGFYFGDQEEMGLGVRVATAITENNGGLITNSAGVTTAARTWGQPATWCDYSGIINGRHVGIMIIPDPGNPVASWWHNRDYGVFVANAFGRQSMKQGATSRIEVMRGETYQIRYTVILYASEKNEEMNLERLVK